MGLPESERARLATQFGIGQDDVALHADILETTGDQSVVREQVQDTHGWAEDRAEAFIAELMQVLDEQAAG